MEAQHVARGLGQQHAVLDLLRRHAHQAQGVVVHARGLARDVERAGQLAASAEDRRRRAAQPAVLRQVVLAAQHHQRHTLGQRGADGVGAAVALRPFHAGLQRHALGLGQEVGAADLLEDQATGVR
ncbi:hypothetical protein D3C72_1936580 [compost metagenome]